MKPAKRTAVVKSGIGVADREWRIRMTDAGLEAREIGTRRRLFANWRAVIGTLLLFHPDKEKERA